MGPRHSRGHMQPATVAYIVSAGAVRVSPGTHASMASKVLSDTDILSAFMLSCRGGSLRLQVHVQLSV